MKGITISVIAHNSDVFTALGAGVKIAKALQVEHIYVRFELGYQVGDAGFNIACGMNSDTQDLYRIYQLELKLSETSKKVKP